VSACGSGPPSSLAMARNSGSYGNERLQRAEVGRRLDRDRAAGVDQHLADEVEPLLRAGRDENLRRAHCEPLARHLGGDPLAQRREAFARRVLQRLARCVAQDALGRLTYGLDREGVCRGQAAGEREDARKLGQLQDLPDRRRIHARRARGEAPRRGGGKPMHRDPWQWSSSVGRATSTAPVHFGA
jgi:hypothetical protein